MRVLMIAFAHPDNVLSLYKNVKNKIHISLVFVVAGDKFKQGVLNIDISSLHYGINGADKSARIMPEEINRCLGNESEIRIVRTHDRKLLRDKYFRNFRTIRNAAKILVKENYDVIHFNGASGFILYLLFYFRKSKKIWTLHDYKPHSGEENRSGYIFQKLLTKGNVHIIQHYRYLRDQVIKEYKMPENKVHHVYSGKFDIFNCFKAHTVPDVKNLEYILYFGRISRYKGIDYLIDTFSKIQAKRGIKLVIAGGGKLWFEHDKTNRDTIILNRYIETPELVYLIQNCRFVVVPYTDATHSATIMAAYAFNKPVITSGIDGIKEVVDQYKTGILVTPGNGNEFRKAMESLIHDDELIKRMGENIQEYCRNSHIAWEKVTEELGNVYNRVLSS